MRINLVFETFDFTFSRSPEWTGKMEDWRMDLPRDGECWGRSERLGSNAQAFSPLDAKDTALDQRSRVLGHVVCRYLGVEMYGSSVTPVRMCLMNGAQSID